MAQAEYTTAVLADTPVAFWKLDEASGLPQDSSGNGRHFTTVTRTPEYQQTGPFSGSFGIRFGDGAGTESFTMNVFSTAVDNITMEAWFQQTASGNTAATCANGTIGGSDGCGFDYVAGGVFTGFINGTSDANLGFVRSIPAPWSHWAIVRRSGTWEIYFNGDLFSLTSVTQAPATPTGSFQIGCSPNDTANIFYASNVSLYESALSASRIRAHYVAALDVTYKPLNNRTASGAVLV